MNTTVLEKPVFKTWKTIKLSTLHKIAHDFRLATRDTEMVIDEWADEFISDLVSDKEVEVELVVVSVADLGYENGAPRKDVFIRAHEFGLGFCTLDVVLQLRSQYTDQPKGEMLVIAMEPIRKYSDSFLFEISHFNDELSLGANGGYHSDSVLSGHRRLVFCKVL